MANNFFLNQDPLLFQQPQYRNPDGDADLQKQMNDTLMQYKMYQQQQNKDIQNFQYDYITDLDKQTKNISQDVIDELSNNEEYQKLNKELTDIIQRELINSIKWKINSNSIAVQNINKQIEIIDNLKKDIDSEQRKNMNELNDYVKNYSNITFDEYKKIKNGEKLTQKKIKK